MVEGQAAAQTGGTQAAGRVAASWKSRCQPWPHQLLCPRWPCKPVQGLSLVAARK